MPYYQDGCMMNVLKLSQCLKKPIAKNKRHKTPHELLDIVLTGKAGGSGLFPELNSLFGTKGVLWGSRKF